MYTLRYTMGFDLILSSENKSGGSMREPVWDIDSRVPSGKLSIKKINYENYANIDWTLIDHIPPLSGFNNPAWFSRVDNLGFDESNPPTSVGSASDLTQRYTEGGTMESLINGYNEIKIQTVSSNFEGSGKQAYWIFSKETRDVFGKQSQDGLNGTLTVGDEDTFLFNKFPLLDSWDFQDSVAAKSFYVDPNYTTSSPATGPFIVAHNHTNSVLQAFYLENGNAGSANVNNSVGHLTQYGIQIYIRRYIPFYNPYAIVHQSGAVGARDYLTGYTKNKPPLSFTYFQLFIPGSASSSFNIQEVRLLNTAGDNVLLNNAILVPTDSNNSLAIGTNPSSSHVKSGDSINDIIDNSFLSNCVVGLTNDNLDAIIQFKLNRPYVFDEFNRLEVYFLNNNGPFDIIFRDASYQVVTTNSFYNSIPNYGDSNDSLVILEMLGPNPLKGFTNSIDDDIETYILSWADETSIADTSIYRKSESVTPTVGIGGQQSLIRGPMRTSALAMITPPLPNDVLKNSYRPDKSVAPVNWSNNGDISFRLESINERSLINLDQTPKSYSIECHICNCVN